MSALLTPEQRRKTLHDLEELWRVALTPPSDVPPDEWCEKNIVLPGGKESEAGGFLHLDRSPYVRPILSLLGPDHPECHTITLCWASQSSKTLFIWLALAYTAAESPGPCLFVMSTREMAEDAISDRFDELVELSPLLRSLKTEDYGRKTRKFRAATIKTRGGFSSRTTKSTPVKLLALDEIEDFRPPTKTDSGTLHQIKNRTKGWLGSKTIQSGCPKLDTGNAWQQFQQGSMEFYELPCPHADCGKFQRLLFSQVKWNKKHKREDGTWDVDAVKADCWYECVHCGKRIDEKHKQDMLLKGRWVAEHPERKGHRSFHLSSLYPLWVSWGRTAEVFLSTKDFPDAHKDWQINWLAEPLSLLPKSETKAKLREKISTYKQGEVPEPPVALILSADVSGNCCYFVVRAWTTHETSFLVDYGTTNSKEELIQRSRMSYGGYGITATVVDSGNWGEDIMPWCFANGFVPIKGYQRLNSPVKWSQTERGLLLISTVDIKDALMSKINEPIGQAGSWHLFNEPARDYFVHMTSEEALIEPNKDGFPVRTWKKVRDPNHFWDAEVYNLAAARIMGLRFRVAPPVQDEKPSVNDVQPQATGSFWDL